MAKGRHVLRDGAVNAHVGDHARDARGWSLNQRDSFNNRQMASENKPQHLFI